jgi:hypothetical protein
MSGKPIGKTAMTTNVGKQGLTMASKNKLRRQRKFAEGEIQSQLPNTDVPHSRRYTRRGPQLRAEQVVTASAQGLTLDGVIDRIVCGDSVTVLRQLPEEWCACTITSPPYWHTVDYGVPGQIGLVSYDQYLNDLDDVWNEIGRVLVPNGKFCLNVPILPVKKEISEKAFGPSHTRVLLDLYDPVLAEPDGLLVDRHGLSSSSSPRT